MPLLPDQLDDFVQATQKRYTKKKWSDISLPFQDYKFAELIARGKESEMEKGGTQLEFKVQVANTGTFKSTELFGTDNPGVVDLIKAVTVPWTMQTVNWTYDVNETEFQGDDDTMIVDEIDIRRHSAWNDFYTGMETLMWTAPTGPTDVPRTPLGIPTWIVKSSTAAFGFNGTNPSGFTDGVGGLSSTTYPTWANGTFTYAQIDKLDLCAKWKEAYTKCQFKAPHSYNDINKGPRRYGFYSVYSVIAALERLLENSNDNLGTDLGKYAGAVMFKGVPVEWVPALDNTASAAYDSTNPIYGIDWNVFGWKFQKGINQKWLPPVIPPRQSTVRYVPLINAGQFQAADRRRLFVGKAS